MAGFTSGIKCSCFLCGNHFQLKQRPPYQISESGENKQPSKALSLKEILTIKGAKPIMLCYCAIEQTAGLWAASYLTILLVVMICMYSLVAKKN